MKKLFLVIALLLAIPVLAQQTSDPKVFTITAAPPVKPGFTALSPSSVVAGSPQITLTITGSAFQTNAVVQWTPTPTGSTTTALVTTFVSATSLTAVVPASLLTAAGTVNITVLNPILVSQHHVDLQWIASTTSGVTYSVQRSTTPGGPYTTVASNISATAASDATVVNGLTYYYTVVAVNPSGTSNPSNEVQAVIPA